ncbi:hypothetical protein DdX_05486 [Ditylenchus destructor]|uniref:Uncharacterized protein n=1 Tax=Ditylenchus destructor TaxID=166010 RepID=A0AAD4N920_9BILA|nr:hypothetical protein DdX_05486 [Ditylenchus destructor]
MMMMISVAKLRGSPPKGIAARRNSSDKLSSAPLCINAACNFTSQQPYCGGWDRPSPPHEQPSYRATQLSGGGNEGGA